jgi:hypothetical protein
MHVWGPRTHYHLQKSYCPDHDGVVSGIEHTLSSKNLFEMGDKVCLLQSGVVNGQVQEAHA